VLPVYDPLLNILRELAALRNVTVRPSALNFGDLPPLVKGLHSGSTADMRDETKAYQCPAIAEYGGHCGPAGIAGMKSLSRRITRSISGNRASEIFDNLHGARCRAPFLLLVQTWCACLVSAVEHVCVW
jgi:hypothetical protein